VDRLIEFDWHTDFSRFAIHQNAAQQRNTKRSGRPVHRDVTGRLDASNKMTASRRSLTFGIGEDA
jgi:hypothetical protein